MNRLTFSLELAYRIPNRILSLSLVVTRAGGTVWANMPSVCAQAFLEINTNDQCVPAHRLPAVCEVILPLYFLFRSSDSATTQTALHS